MADPWEIARICAGAGEIETDRLFLRPARSADAEDLLHARNSPFVNRYNLYPRVTLDELRRELQSVATFTMVQKASQMPIGLIYVKDDPIRTPGFSFELAGWVREEFAGQGYTYETLCRLIPRLFAIDAVKRLVCHVFTKNLASNRLMEKCGFRVEGTLQEAAKCPDGTFVDEVLYTISKSEFQAMTGLREKE